MTTTDASYSSELTPAPNREFSLNMVKRSTAAALIVVALIVGALIGGHQAGRFSFEEHDGVVVKMDRLTGKVTVWQGNHWQALEDRIDFEPEK